jgi:hypothetical protein
VARARRSLAKRARALLVVTAAGESRNPGDHTLKPTIGLTILATCLVFVLPLPAHAQPGGTPTEPPPTPTQPPPTPTEPAPAPASAGAADPAPTWHLAAGIGTDFPISVGARAHVEAPFRLRLSTSIGILPGPYVSTINAFVVGVGGYDDATADLITSALSSSLIWRTHLGYRPFQNHGLYGEIGYGLVTLGGSATGSELLAGVTGATLPPSDRTSPRTFDVASTLHMLDIEVGWDFPVSDHFQLRAAIGAALTVASSTTVDSGSTGRGGVAAAFESAAAGYLDDTYTAYVFTPVLSVSGSYVVF